MNQHENRLSEALRGLNTLAPDGASPAIGDMLKNEFRRHHVQRRKKRTAQISLFAACLVASVALSMVLLRPRAPYKAAGHEAPQMLQQLLPNPASIPATALSSPTVVKPRSRARALKNPSSDTDSFVALPTFDPAIPIDHSQMIRLDLPGRALRLVGFPVSEEFADRRVLADVLLAQDGTPYALRLVQSSQNKEQ